MRVLMIDNYDSFTYNLVQYFGELGEDVRVFRNDEIGVDEIAKLNEAVGRSLCLELDKTHRYPVKGDVTVYAFLIAKMPALR